MNGAGIGRVLVASLHQGVADILPTRLEFYENWLNPAGLRDGKIGLAPLGAVFSFLREEGEERYDLVMGRAGQYAADWTFVGMSRLRQGLIRGAPVPLRVRWTLRVARGLVRDSYQSSRAMVRVRKGVATVDLRGSIFCGVREPANRLLCSYYASAIGRLLERVELQGNAHVAHCRGVGDPRCVITVALGTGHPGLASTEMP